MSSTGGSQDDRDDTADDCPSEIFRTRTHERFAELAAVTAARQVRMGEMFAPRPNPILELAAANQARFADIFRPRTADAFNEMIASHQIRRSPQLIRFASARSVLDSARHAEPEAGLVDRLFDEIARRAATSDPPPLADDGLVDDPAAMHWFAALHQQVMQVSGLSERDLTEDALAGYVYALTLSIAVVLLLQYPLLLGLQAVAGVGAHHSGVALSRSTRHTYRRLTTSTEGDDDTPEEEDSADEAEPRDQTD